MRRVSWEEWTEGSYGQDTVYEGRIYFQGRKGRKKGTEGRREGRRKENTLVTMRLLTLRCFGCCVLTCSVIPGPNSTFLELGT